MELVQGAVVRQINEMCSTRTYQYRFHIWHSVGSPHLVNNITRALLLELMWLANYVLNYVPSYHHSRREGSCTQFCTIFASSEIL
jgi:hypothetical protein